MIRHPRANYETAAFISLTVLLFSIAPQLLLA
jgi:hypothetical protein